MGKTYRRKDVKGNGGYYEDKDEVRNKQGASDAYIHSDMPSRDGRWLGANHPYKLCKDEANSLRRQEAKSVEYLALYEEDPEDILSFNNDDWAKTQSNKAWQFS